MTFRSMERADRPCGNTAATYHWQGLKQFRSGLSCLEELDIRPLCWWSISWHRQEPWKTSKTKNWQETESLRRGRSKHSPLIYLSFKVKCSVTKVKAVRFKSQDTAWWEAVKGKFMQDPQHWVKTFLWSPVFPSRIPTCSPPFVFS